MQIVRRRGSWDPFREMEDLSQRMNRLFNLAPLRGEDEKELLAASDWAPSCDIRETANDYRIHAELAGVKKEDVHVTLEEGVLTLKGERREEKEEQGERFHRRELSHGSFLRRFTMPNDADESKIDATFKDGILNVVIGKTEASAQKTKEIAVH